MPRWKTDEELFDFIRAELATCVVSDVMGQLGFQFPMLPPSIRALRNDMVVVGRAMPVQDEAPLLYGGPARFDSKPFGLLPESIEALRPNEVYIATGGPSQSARLGHILMLRAQKLGAAGVVINAQIRNARETLTSNLPVFAQGFYGQGLQHRHNVVDFRCSIIIGSVRIKPGDLIFGDCDGVCVIPHEAEKEIVSKAALRSEMERNVREEIEANQSILNAFEKHGIR